MKTLTRSGIGIILSGMIISAHAGGISGPYLGLGGSWNTVDETTKTTLAVSPFQSGNDRYYASSSRFSPSVQIGYWAPVYSSWLWGVSAQWNYLGYKTENDHASRGQNLPNATFSSINIFGPNVIRDFSSQSQLNNEALFLGFLGLPTTNGFVYLGIGPALLTATNSIYVTSIHTPAGTGNQLTAGSVSSNHILWGGAVQVGYNYYLEPTIFLSLNYTYLYSGKYNFNNSVNAAELNGFDVPGPTELDLNRSVSFRAQGFMFSINKVFC